jgi:hypothetical protein
MTTENDLVLIYFEGEPLIFARVERIVPDNKPDWYHVTLLMLQVPLQTVTWILRDVYINGETFTMNGKEMRLEKVEAPAVPGGDRTDDDQASGDSDQAASKVISFADLKKE